MVLPIFGAVALAGGTVFERFILKHKNLSIKAYQILSFLGIVILMAPFMYFFWDVDAGALTIKNILLFASVIVFSIIANLFVFYSVKWEKITKLEPAKVLEPLFVILLALVFSFFADGVYDRNLKVVIPAIVSGIALVVTHIKKNHLEFNKYFIAAILGSFFFALELVLSGLILDLYSPMSFYFLRSLFVLLVSWVIFMPKIGKISNSLKWQILLTSGIWIVYRVVTYYGYLTLGVIYTTLILMLAPVLVYAFAYFFLKEKMSWKNFIAAAIIVASIVYVMF